MRTFFMGVLGGLEIAFLVAVCWALFHIDTRLNEVEQAHLKFAHTQELILIDMRWPQ